MSDSRVPPSLPLRSDFPRKVALLVLFITNTAFGIFFLLGLRPETHQLVRHFLADLTMGLVAGFGARILFRQRNWFVRFISALASMIIGLLILGALTNWRTGLGQLYFWRNTIDWTGLAQILLGMTGMFLAMLAWSKPGQAARNTIPVVPAAPPPLLPEGQTRARSKRRRTKQALPAGASANGILPKNGSTRTKNPAKPVISRKRASRTENKPAARLFLRKPKVRLSRVEKHLCPYCLEPVARKDPRGVVECEICHTLHHGDCWAIAGSCQVPHYTA